MGGSQLKKEFLYISALMWSCVVSGWAQKETPKTAPKPYVAAVFTTGKNWDTTKTAYEQPHFKEHGANLKRLHAEGKIALGARYGEFGLVVFKTESMEEVRACFDQDSIVIKDILRMDIQPFRPFYKGCID